MLVRVERHPNGPRLHLGRWRWHHYSSGATLIAFGVWLVYGDRTDLRAVFHRPSLPVFDPEVGLTTSHNKGVW